MTDKAKYIFPCLLILLQFGASMVYLAKGDFRMFTYWISAAILNTAVTL